MIFLDQAKLEREMKLHKALKGLAEALEVPDGEVIDFSSVFRVNESGGVSVQFVSLSLIMDKYILARRENIYGDN